MNKNDIIDYNDSDTEELTEEDIENIEFEQVFYTLLAGTENLEIIPIPDEDGFVIDNKELKLIQNECSIRGIKLLYRISHGKTATIFDPVLLKIGVVPEFNLLGFSC
jgi:hypothetical protein